jgi:dihydrofolate reductase
VIRYATAISLDGFTAGPEQSLENPLGIGGMRLHDWVFELAAWRKPHGMEGGIETPSSAVVEAGLANVGAYVMGRNMFGGGPGPWPEDEPWNGWWGDDPPFHLPVFVVTHHAREPLECEGGTTFTFVTDGVESAIGQAQDVAGGKDVTISGGSSVAKQALAVGLLDEIRLDLVPLVLGGGVRLFDGEIAAELEQIAVVEGRGVTHLTYRVSR